MQGHFDGGLHPRYEPKEAYAQVRREISGAVPASR